MSEENGDGEWAINDEGKVVKKEQSGRKVRIEVSRDAEVDSLHEELAKVRNQLAEGDQERIEAEKGIMALEMFQKTKEYEARLRPTMKDSIMKCNSPSELEHLVQSIHPSGKAQMEKLDTSSDQSLDEIYSILRFPQDYSKETVKDAQQKREALMTNLLSSPSLETMRREGKTVYASNSLMFCPKCERNHFLSTIDIKKGEKCSRCGYTPTEDERRR